MARPGFQLPLLLLAGFESIIDETHRRLADQGHPEFRPAHGFAMQAVGQGASVSEVGRLLGVSKQAAAKTIDRLIILGYLRLDADPADARSKIATPTKHGVDVLRRSAMIFAEIADEWASTIGRRRLDRLQDDLAELVGDKILRLDGLAGFLPEDGE